MTTSPPTGFVRKPKPKSVAEAFSQNSHDRLKTIAKGALAGYINSFLDTQGVNRSLITAASPGGLTFVTDKSLQDSTDPQYKPTQLARFYNEIRQQLPSILIIDSGFQWIPSGLNGGLEAASNVNGKWQGYFRVTGKVPVTVAVVTKDQDTTDMLMNILMMLFDSFRNISGGSRLHSATPSDTWEVRIPLTFTIGTTTPEEYEGDPVGRYWSARIEMELDVEDQLAIEMEMPKADILGYVVNNPNLSESQPPVITAPTTVSLKNGSFSISVYPYMPVTHRIVIDDPNIATLEMGNIIQVTPHRTGSFKIKVVGQDLSGVDRNPKAPFTYKELAVANVTVIW